MNEITEHNEYNDQDPYVRKYTNEHRDVPYNDVFCLDLNGHNWVVSKQSTTLSQTLIHAYSQYYSYYLLDSLVTLDKIF